MVIMLILKNLPRRDPQSGWQGTELLIIIFPPLQALNALPHSRSDPQGGVPRWSGLLAQW